MKLKSDIVRIQIMTENQVRKVMHAGLLQSVWEHQAEMTQYTIHYLMMKILYSMANIRTISKMEVTMR